MQNPIAKQPRTPAQRKKGAKNGAPPRRRRRAEPRPEPGSPPLTWPCPHLGDSIFNFPNREFNIESRFLCHSARFLRSPSHHWLRRGRITLQPRAPGVTRSLLGGARRSGRDGARMVSGPHEPHDCPRWPPSDQADPQGRPEATLGTWRRHGPRGNPTQPQKHHPLCTLRLDLPKIDPCPSPHFPAPYRLDPSESDARRDQCAVVLTCARIP